MTTLKVSHDLEPEEMVETLAALGRAQGLESELVEELRKSESPSPEPELFLRTIVDKLGYVYKEAVAVLATNLERWFPGNPLEKSQNRSPLYLTQAQIDELVSLIRAHFRVVLRIGANFAPAEYERRWRELGLIAPTVRISPYVRDAFLAGRLNEVLTSNSSFEQMRFAARGLQMTRPLELMLEAVQRDVSMWMLRPTESLAGAAEGVLLAQSNQVVRAIIDRYIRGDLRPTQPNSGPLTPQEVAAAEVPGRVETWRSLARELRNRLLSSDAGRDWDRVAATETRFAYNMGRLSDFRERGVAAIEWHVQPDACAFCKLLLTEGGVPRRFSSATIANVLARTGGTNFGRRASRIGQDDGWLPTASIHPWCRCTPYPAGTIEGSDGN